MRFPKSFRSSGIRTFPRRGWPSTSTHFFSLEAMVENSSAASESRLTVTSAFSGRSRSRAPSAGPDSDRAGRAALRAGPLEGIATLYLLTTSAEAYFRRFGFESLARDQAVPALEASEELRGACPASAVLMRILLQLFPNGANHELRTANPADLVDREAALLKIRSQLPFGTTRGTRGEHQSSAGSENAAELREVCLRRRE